MTGATASTARTGSRGRIDKRQAILDAAFTVFARRGYAQACVQEIAEEAGVAKPTVYNHLSDKENLFRHAMAAAAGAVVLENLAVVERLRDPGDDLRAGLVDVGYRLLGVYCSERARSLRWLTYAQVARFPDLIEFVQERTSHRLADALADRLARLSLAGRLRPCDPGVAAEQFLALLTGPMEARSRLGTREVSDIDGRTVATAAVDTFLRAYAPVPAG
ncbi:TetR/AcrR family transcriptional regulator [Marinitenerispora sediminis]|uniref:TetR family transcriptional regulator n=1 Tax=Marinitenerispora sediminis TaxID=1931232 RepID=A0A368T533_9ACTN|nr:TetR/AcrR family transcriptional regulator [Marinitenerispora sediminis]RCV57805.1 TetR family transcriptional regulator [Marinitenerispora sediminis]RCV58374.1 TetR family transcriptional regulator [Marinitenerispora sediminis]RCV59551.1 TetR family transcriptional regulator [Marinitenerispora sediminis]